MTTPGEVWTSEVFDREELAEYSFTVMAMDIGGRTGFTTLHISVEDENDNKPVFVQLAYKIVIRANATVGSVILKVIIKHSLTFPLLLKCQNPTLHSVHPNILSGNRKTD